MIITKTITNMESEGFENIHYFDDGFKGYSSEKELIITDYNGDQVSISYKSIDTEPHAEFLSNNFTKNEVDFDDVSALEWLNVMGEGASIERHNYSWVIRDGNLIEVSNDMFVTCKFCHNKAFSDTAHLHQGEYVGDECCWDSRLKMTE